VRPQGQQAELGHGSVGSAEIAGGGANVRARLDCG
jgi:hypothetical protein